MYNALPSRQSSLAAAKKDAVDFKAAECSEVLPMESVATALIHLAPLPAHTNMQSK